MNACRKWKDRLLDAALADVISGELREHLSGCANCSATLRELRARRERLDTLLPLLAKPVGPPPDLYPQTIATLEAYRTRRQPSLRRFWTVAGTIAAVVIVAAIGWSWRQRKSAAEAELHQAQNLAQWRSPTQAFLQVPGREFLTSTPKLGESYFNIPTKTEQRGEKE